MILKNAIYLDNSHVTRPSSKAVQSLMPYLSDKWGVISQPHEGGQELYPLIQKSYDTLYKSLKAKPEDLIIFTNSGAEAVNQVILGTYFSTTIPTGKNHFIVGKSDEAPAIMSIGRLDSLGCVGSMVEVLPKHLIEAITPRTALLSLSWGNGLTGTLAPIQEILPILKERGVKLHLDISHVLGRYDVDLSSLGADFVTLDGSLIHAPKSTGLLFVKADEKMPPFIAGGLDQAGHRGVTLDAGLLAGLSEAVKESVEALDFVVTESARLRFKLEKGIKWAGGKILFEDQERLPHITSASFEGIPNEALLFRLNKDNVFASIGGGNLQQIAYVLSALGIPEIEGGTAVSFSLSRETTEEEIDRTVEILWKNLQELKKLSAHI